MMRLGVKLQGQSTVAIVDTAAEVTIVSDKVFRSWKVKPEVVKYTDMHAVGRGMLMDSLVTSPVTIDPLPTSGVYMLHLLMTRCCLDSIF